MLLPGSKKSGVMNYKQAIRYMKEGRVFELRNFVFNYYVIRSVSYKIDKDKRVTMITLARVRNDDGSWMFFPSFIDMSIREFSKKLSLTDDCFQECIDEGLAGQVHIWDTSSDPSWFENHWENFPDPRQSHWENFPSRIKK
jgi:hypothetical protein